MKSNLIRAWMHTQQPKMRHGELAIALGLRRETVTRNLLQESVSHDFLGRMADTFPIVTAYMLLTGNPYSQQHIGGNGEE